MPPTPPNAYGTYFRTSNRNVTPTSAIPAYDVEVCFFWLPPENTAPAPSARSDRSVDTSRSYMTAIVPPMSGDSAGGSIVPTFLPTVENVAHPASTETACSPSARAAMGAITQAITSNRAGGIRVRIVLHRG